MKNLSKLLIAAGTLAVAIGSTSAGADTLLDLTNPAGQSNTPYLLSFTATSTTTTLTVSGYQLPSSETATQNAVRLGAGANLLGTTWTYTPAPSGALAGQFSDGSGVNALQFAGVTAGSYDMFSQSFATMVGSVYTYSFLFSNSINNPTPSGFRVDVNTRATGAVPEPASWAMMIAGFGLAGSALRRRRSSVRTALTFA